MLARTYKSAAELGRTQPELDALMLALDYLGKSDIPTWRGNSNVEDPPAGDSFDMRLFSWQHQCGTVACLAGYANLLSEGRAFSQMWLYNFMSSFHLENHQDMELAYLFSGGWEKRDAGEAVTALHNYLTTGETRWGGKRYFDNKMFCMQMQQCRNGANAYALAGPNG